MNSQAGNNRSVRGAWSGVPLPAPPDAVGGQAGYFAMRVRGTAKLAARTVSGTPPGTAFFSTSSSCSRASPSCWRTAGSITSSRGKGIGFLIGLAGFVLLPVLVPDAGWMIRWGVLL